ncbi:MAG: group II intron reverse transcriptase/maturase [Planctomycetota bacterium]|nr:group II intron reverse transcriptase/maturase [Planctomycetota bacterium]
MGGTRQKSQNELASETDSRGDAPTAVSGGSEPPVAERRDERLALSERLMEEVCERENMLKALKRVKANRGSPGVDGMKTVDLEAYLKERWPEIREQLLAGTYKPQPVKRVEIPKPDGGGMRKLGIPTALDRLIQQACLQVLQPKWDPTFSEHSYGFRPERSAHQAVEKAQGYLAQGLRWVVDIDLEKFFDRVNHDRLMAEIARRVADKRLLRLIRAFLNAGVLENGLVSPTKEGAPQGGPLSPLLSNLVLDELDRELERRGHRFVRYADDCNIYVRSERAGRRVMDSLGKFITQKLKLKVNSEKSTVARPWVRKFLGFSFTSHQRPKRRIASQAVARLKRRVRGMTRPLSGHSFEYLTGELSDYLRAWRGYFRFCETPSVLRDLDSWIRRRLRCLAWRMWKRGRNRFRELRRLGVSEDQAAIIAGSAHGPWRISKTPGLNMALSIAYFDSRRHLTCLAPRGA